MEIKPRMEINENSFNEVVNKFEEFHMIGSMEAWEIGNSMHELYTFDQNGNYVGTRVYIAEHYPDAFYIDTFEGKAILHWQGTDMSRSLSYEACKDLDEICHRHVLDALEDRFGD